MSKKKLIQKLLLKASVLCFILSVMLAVWYFVSGINILEEKYWQYIDWLTNIEHKVAAIQNKWLIVLVIELLYFILTAFPVFPVSILCVASAMVFDFSQSLFINICGLVILFSVRYSTGKREGGGSAQWLVRRSKTIRTLVEDDGQGNPWVLAVIRLLPLMPINPVSHLYGAMDFPFYRFILISVAGFLPKLISYIIIGNNFANIFSPQFTLPLIILTFISGIFFLLLRGVWNVINKVKER
ncbi:MAG: TVP38/TMEM64 family protein [Clostridia bacterium]|nr:TVP38/TMEM64 family protein [Clostridia bacterium]